MRKRASTCTKPCYFKVPLKYHVIRCIIIHIHMEVHIICSAISMELSGKRIRRYPKQQFSAEYCMFRYMCGELQFLVGHRKCYLPSHALLQARRCYFACRVSSRWLARREPLQAQRCYFACRVVGRLLSHSRCFKS